MEHEHRLWNAECVLKRSGSFRFKILDTVIRHIPNCAACYKQPIWVLALKGRHTRNSHRPVRRQHSLQLNERIPSDSSIGSRLDDKEGISTDPAIPTNLLTAHNTFKKE